MVNTNCVKRKLPILLLDGDASKKANYNGDYAVGRVGRRHLFTATQERALADTSRRGIARVARA
jgi:hypothetical protein